tara:strand:+ start:9528 stop:9791 length:264 start_codon:yes stop_codon:yes gene_type:complete
MNDELLSYRSRVFRCLKVAADELQQGYEANAYHSLFINQAFIENIPAENVANFLVADVREGSSVCSHGVINHVDVICFSCCREIASF